MYRCETWWWEICETYRRLSLTGLLAVLASGSVTQLTLATFVCIVSLNAYAAFKPFEETADTVLAVSAQIVLLLMVFAALLGKLDSNLFIGSDGKFIGGLLTATTILVIAISVIMVNITFTIALRFF